MNAYQEIIALLGSEVEIPRERVLNWIDSKDLEIWAVLYVLTDEASLLDAVGTDPDEMLHRLALYFGGDFSFSLRQPIWKLVDEIKAVYSGWPSDS